MNTGSIVALFVSVLGSFIILSLVFLVYKWRSGINRSNASVVDEEYASSQMQQYRLRRGRMVPKETTQSVISTRSGWQSLRHATIIFNTPNTATKVDQSSIRTVDVKNSRRHRPRSSVPTLVPLPSDWRKKLQDVQTKPGPNEQTIPNPTRPQLSLTVPSQRRESWKSLKSPRERWKQLHETIHELETPPSEPANPFDTPKTSAKSSRKSSRASSHPTTFLESPTRDSFYPTTPRSPPPAYMAPSMNPTHPALR